MQIVHPCCLIFACNQSGSLTEIVFHIRLHSNAFHDAVFICVQPVMFVCRNNGFAISTPSREQLRSDGVAGRAVGGYGVTAFRVDGNDVVATILAIRAARDYIIENQKPALVELMSYRGGDHSTSDDSSLYRDKNARHFFTDPLKRFASFVETKGWCDSSEIDTRLDDQRAFALDALERAEREPKAEPLSLFDHVYSAPMPQSLNRQREELKSHLERQARKEDKFSPIS
jgi:2-oxoisovalerate dehydrogenase E1 component alpha subunit